MQGIIIPFNFASFRVAAVAMMNMRCQVLPKSGMHPTYFCCAVACCAVLCRAVLQGVPAIALSLADHKATQTQHYAAPSDVAVTLIEVCQAPNRITSLWLSISTPILVDMSFKHCL